MLHTAELENQYLKRDIQKWPEDFRVSTANSHQIVNEATLVLEKLKSFKDVKIDDIGIYSHRIDKKSKVNAIYFFFKSGGYVKVACVDYSKEIEDKWGWSDNVRVDIGTEEFSNFLMYEAYE